MPTFTRRQIVIALSSGVATAGGGSLWPAAGSDKQPKKYEIERTPEEWRKLLTPAQYNILREHGTERAFTHPYDKLYDAGVYHCAGCDLPLYSSTTKYDSRTGWPSFWKPLDNAIGTREDRTLWLMVRTEVHCRRCGGHLGHVFDDGPPPTRRRYCMNGAAMKFVPAAAGTSEKKS
jgi:peptide-methionine (R)-S-oxide reductase